MSFTVSPAVKAQVIRFARLFAITFGAQEATLAGPVTRSVLISTAVSAAEVAFRAVWPAKLDAVKAVEEIAKPAFAAGVAAQAQVSTTEGLPVVTHPADPTEPGSVATS